MTGLQQYPGSFLMPSLGHANVSDAMHPGVLFCEPETSLTDVARMMATHHVHCIVVMGVMHGAPMESLGWGIVSDLEVLRAGICDDAEPTAGALAREPLITVEPTMALREAGQLMLAHRVRHLVVVQPGTRRPIGVLSTADVAGVLARGEA
jgi:CBS domain-containing protein